MVKGKRLVAIAATIGLSMSAPPSDATPILTDVSAVIEVGALGPVNLGNAGSIGGGTEFTWDGQDNPAARRYEADFDNLGAITRLTLRYDDLGTASGIFGPAIWRFSNFVLDTCRNDIQDSSERIARRSSRRDFHANDTFDHARSCVSN